MIALTVLIFSSITFISTALGGLLSFKFKEKLNHVMGFTAGVLLGVVAFDIFPEIIEQVSDNNYNSIWPMLTLVLGFLLFHSIEKGIIIHHADEEDCADHTHPKIGVASALALIGHSLLDGIGIGLGFQINNNVGFLIAIAVISHAFTDGMNTVTFMLHHKNTTKRTKWFLLFDALAPILGALSTLFFTVPHKFLILYLGFFAGFFLYIGASDILPEAHRKKSSYTTILLTVLGAALIFLITRLA